MRPGHRMTRRVESHPKPVVAAVNDLAFGGGCELVEATHIAVAADGATFSGNGAAIPRPSRLGRDRRPGPSPGYGA